MASEKSLAIVLRVVSFSETSVVATLYTRAFGKISGLAKGARRPKSPFEAALDLLAVCRIVFIHKSSTALDLLTEAKLERRFRAATRDLSRLYAGYYVAELLHGLTDHGDPNPELFDAANRTLQELDGDQPLAPLILRFELAALKWLGHLPSWDQCVGCGCPIELAGRVPFGQLQGGVLCPSCRGGRKQVVQVSAEVIRTLQAFSEASESRPAVDLDPRWRGELRAVVNRYFANLLGRPLRLHEYLGSLSH